MSVYKAIGAVASELAATGITKTQRNNQGAGYNFRGIDDVYNAIGPLLAKHGLNILPRALSRECTERQSAAGKPVFYVSVQMEFDFVALDGSKHTVCMFGEAMDPGDKATNKAMSAAYKYAMFQAFCIPTEGDNDADAHTPEALPQKVEFVRCTKEQEAQISALIDSTSTDIVQLFQHFSKISGIELVDYSDISPDIANRMINVLTKKANK
jgi:hypothetical protein